MTDKWTVFTDIKGQKKFRTPSGYNVGRPELKWLSNDSYDSLIKIVENQTVDLMPMKDIYKALESGHIVEAINTSGRWQRMSKINSLENIGWQMAARIIKQDRVTSEPARELIYMKEKPDLIEGKEWETISAVRDASKKHLIGVRVDEDIYAPDTLLKLTYKK